jgi:hypothetical protein
MMTDMISAKHAVSFGTQPFLVLCQLFDGCYDELSKRQEIQEVTEHTAAELLSGVAFLKEQCKPPKQVVVALSLPEIYFLQKLLKEMLGAIPEETSEAKTRGWLKECVKTLAQAAAAV